MEKQISPSESRLGPLDKEARKDGGHPYLRPKDAATLILIDQSQGKEPLILMGRRHEKHKFMPGLFVFPGGRVDRGDGDMTIAQDLMDRDKKALLFEMKGRPSTRRCRALALAAIRETYEETGLMLGQKTQENSPARQCPGWDSFKQQNIRPDLSALKMVARAITPPGRPRRFDTRFFIAATDSISYKNDAMVGPDSELQELHWLAISDAKKLELPAITLTILDEVSTQLSNGLLEGSAVQIPYFYANRKGFQRNLITI